MATAKRRKKRGERAVVVEALTPAPMPATPSVPAAPVTVAERLEAAYHTIGYARGEDGGWQPQDGAPVLREVLAKLPDHSMSAPGLGAPARTVPGRTRGQQIAALRARLARFDVTRPCPVEAAGWLVRLIVESAP